MVQQRLCTGVVADVLLLVAAAGGAIVVSAEGLRLDAVNLSSSPDMMIVCDGVYTSSAESFSTPSVSLCMTLATIN